jgi:hypothetical protein
VTGDFRAEVGTYDIIGRDLCIFGKLLHSASFPIIKPEADKNFHLQAQPKTLTFGFNPDISL